MSRKIKFHSLNILFKFFSFLADKTGGWQVFVKPKLIIGSLIIGLGLTGCNSNSKNSSINNSESKNTDLIEDVETCYVITPSPLDSVTLCYDTSDVDKIYIDKDSVYIITEEMPEFPGGSEIMLSYISKNIKYPETAIKDKLQGRVVVQFIVRKTGAIEKVEVVRSISTDCDKEAIRVVRSFPKWIPGKQKGKNVDVKYYLPINFKLE